MPQGSPDSAFTARATMVIAAVISGPDAAAQIGHVVHVLDRDAVHAAVAVHAALGDGLGFDLAHGETAAWSARQRADVNHADDGFRRAEHATFSRLEDVSSRATARDLLSDSRGQSGER